MIEGSYEICLDGKRVLKPATKGSFEVMDGSSKIEWLGNDEVRITCDSQDKIELLKVIAQIAMRRASVQRDRAWPSGYRNFALRELSLNENGRPVDKGKLIVSDATAYFDDFDAAICKQTTSELLGTEYESLIFLMRSTDLIEQLSELSVLSAFTALELTLAKLIPSGGDVRESFNRIAILDFLRVLSKQAIEKLWALNNLRNKLAHGVWQDTMVGDALNRLLGGGPNKWIGPSGRMNKEAGRRVIEEIMASVVILTHRRRIIEDTLKKISELQKM